MLQGKAIMYTLDRGCIDIQAEGSCHHSDHLIKSLSRVQLSSQQPYHNRHGHYHQAVLFVIITAIENI